MKQYHDLVKFVLENGERKHDRTGTGTISYFGYQTKYDLRQGFPLLTTKKVNFPAVVRELLWFLRGSTNINDDLTQHTSIWDAWAPENGELGPIYGYQWRSWPRYVETQVEHSASGKSEKLYRREHVDQLSEVIKTIKTNPDSRRMLVTAWNVSDLDRMALPPCHMMFQFYVVNGRLDIQLYQRSADIAVGVPFNIASYALLNIMVAQECGLTPGIFTHTFGDAHIYLDHLDGLNEQLKRTPGKLPTVTVAKKPVLEIGFDDIQLHDYVHQGFIKFPVAV